MENERDNVLKMDDVAKAIALCPLDGRYAKIGESLAEYFSEYGLVKNRVWVECNWLCYLVAYINDNEILKKYGTVVCPQIMAIYKDFSIEDFKKVKEIEKETNHDVKAVERFVGKKLVELDMKELVSFVHIGCTSEDITNCAYANILKGAVKLLISTGEKVINAITEFAEANADVPLLAHTHGQPATPTSVGKEFKVYAYRLEQSLAYIKNIKFRAKFNGATGTHAALKVAFPNYDWIEMTEHFVTEYLELDYNPITTQIESHDYMCHLFDAIAHFNNVVKDFDVDIWLYISKEYIKQIPVEGEVGSSTMPHKVNPINFENSESNTTLATDLFRSLSNKLPISRLQRDLTDSSTSRNIGIAFGYSLQAYSQTLVGLGKIAINQEKVLADLKTKWQVLSEPIQQVLRTYGNEKAYDELKELTRGKETTKKIIHDFINSLDLSDKDRNRLLELTPETYNGYASELARY